MLVLVLVLALVSQCCGFQSTGLGRISSNSVSSLNRQQCRPPVLANGDHVRLRMEESKSRGSDSTSTDSKKSSSRTPDSSGLSRRGFVSSTSAAAWTGAAALCVWGTNASPSSAIGDLPEYKDNARFAQHAVINVPDMEEAVRFYTKGMGLKVLRTITDEEKITTFIAQGPEELKVPSDWVLGVSSPALYGGHFSLELVQRTSSTPEARDFFDPGNGLQFVQFALESYRISKIAEFGGKLISGYGYLKVEAPGGLVLNIMSGDRRDVVMFPCFAVKDMRKSIAWYEKVLGMQQFAYPQVRYGSNSPFEPEKPNGAVFMAYDKDGTGVLLVPAARKAGPINPGSVWDKMAILGTDVEATGRELGAKYVGKAPGTDTSVAVVSDPDGYSYVLVEYEDWAKEKR